MKTQKSKNRRTWAFLENSKMIFDMKKGQQETTPAFLENPNPKNRRKWAFLENQKWKLSKIQKN